MSIFVQQPRRKRGLSGLGAFNELLPAIRERGVSALLDGEWACDFELIYARVYDELARMPMYARNTTALQADAEAYARRIWLARCPQASYVVNEYNLYQNADGVWHDHGGHGHHRHPHHRHHGPHAPMYAPHHGGGAMAPMRHAPMQHAGRAPGMAPGRAAPMHHAGRAQGMAPMPHSSNRGMRVRGMGDGEAPTLDQSVTRRLQQQIASSRSSAGRTVAAARATTSSVSAITDRAAAMIYPFANFTPGTLDPCVDPTTGAPIPCERMTDAQRAMCAACGGTDTPSPMPSAFSIEGALPTAVAGLLGLGLGLTVVSMFVGK